MGKEGWLVVATILIATRMGHGHARCFLAP